MSYTAKQCLERAEHCERMASQAKDRDAKMAFGECAKQSAGACSAEIGPALFKLTHYPNLRAPKRAARRPASAFPGRRAPRHPGRLNGDADATGDAPGPWVPVPAALPISAQRFQRAGGTLFLIPFGRDRRPRWLAKSHN